MYHKNTMHLLHLVLTLLFIPWAIIWLYRTLANNTHNKQVDAELQRRQHEEILMTLRNK